MMQILLRPDQLGLERSMRIWALADETVLASVQRSGRRVLYAVRHGAGLPDASGSLRERVVEFMLRR
jgi:hypothetical protein